MYLNNDHTTYINRTYTTSHKKRKITCLTQNNNKLNNNINNRISLV